jgi:trehalose 6-phosphate phosphatase
MTDLAPFPPLPPRAALLLDLDGTLIDIAPTPDQVSVPAGLLASLRTLRPRLRDALAIVTGRPVEQVDRLLGAAPYAVAGEHGAVIRHSPQGALERAGLPPTPANWAQRARQAAAAYSGALFEPKSHGFVLHYRRCPDAGEALRQALLAIIGADHPDYAIMPAHMAWEVTPRGVDKGQAVQRLLARPPFAGRTPVYVGDDVSDEHGMRAARQAGGVGLRVPEVFGDAAGVRAWLAHLAASGAGAD